MVTGTDIYKDIAMRTGGDIYIGVVGPVRTGKSTFIKRFMDTLVLPHMDNEYQRTRANDELPQSAAGRTIMTTEPKFIPEQGAEITLGDHVGMQVRLIDCVGYIVPSALGYIEDEQPRMVKTPWFDEEIPFNMAAEMGTAKVISEHSTIGLVVTTDGSITDIPRTEYAEAEARVIAELQGINKPFVVLLNSMHPEQQETQQLAMSLREQYAAPVIAVNCREMGETELLDVLREILFEFPVEEMRVSLPRWLLTLEREHPVRRAVLDAVRAAATTVEKISEVKQMGNCMESCRYVDTVKVSGVDLGTGSAHLQVTVDPTLFYQILGETTGISLKDEGELMTALMQMADTCKKYERIRGALEEAQATGYGIVMPDVEEMTLEQPEIIKQSGRYGVRLRAAAPSIHLLRADIETEVSPIVGSEKQSEDLVAYLLKEFEESPEKIWESNIFGTSLYGLVNEGLHNKLHHMPTEARLKIKETVERVINEGCNGLICIIV